ncbi:MAG: DUF4278 domain-containing protein [Pleurocapsa sp.]
MKLTYRGINYKAPKQEVKTDLIDNIVSLEKYLTEDTKKSNKDIQVKPIHYYTYRGVSYTKNLVFDNHTKFLLDIDRK